MPDKMLRMAGRGTDGTSKAIQTDEEGITRTVNRKRNQVVATENITIAPGESREVGTDLDLTEFGSLITNARASRSHDYTVYIQRRIKMNGQTSYIGEKVLANSNFNWGIVAAEVESEHSSASVFVKNNSAATQSYIIIEVLGGR